MEKTSLSFVAVVTKMTAKDPQKRFQTPAEVAAALEPFARDQGRETPL
jgi:hypothetical protein